MRASIIWWLMSECQKEKISEKRNYRIFCSFCFLSLGGGVRQCKKKWMLLFSSRLTRQRTCIASLTLFQQENKNLYSLPFSDHSNDGGIAKSALKPRGFDKQQARKHVRCLLYWKYVKSSYVRIFHYRSIIPQTEFDGCLLRLLEYRFYSFVLWSFFFCSQSTELGITFGLTQNQLLKD